MATKTFAQLKFKDIAAGLCPVCGNSCWYAAMREGGRQFGMKHVGDRQLAVFGELVWDTSRKVWWHSSNEQAHPTPYQDALSEMIDDVNYLLMEAK